jgi:fructose-1-phosphate kinase PfkB-like protein
VNETTTYLVLGGGGMLVAGASIAFGVALRPTGPLGQALGRYILKLDGE